MVLKGDIDRAIEDYSSAIQISPNEVDLYIGRGYMWQCKGEYEKAIENYSDALRICPADSPAYFCRGNAWAEKGDLPKAIQDMRAAIEHHDFEQYIKKEECASRLAMFPREK